MQHYVDDGINTADVLREYNIISTWASFDITSTNNCLVTKGKERVKASPVIASLQIHYPQNTWRLEEAWMSMLFFISHCIPLREESTKPEGKDSA